MPADLHIHTNFSDGLLSPEEVVREAKKAKLTTIAIADHDCVDGIDAAIQEGKRIGVEVIPAIEFSTDIPQTEIHILGYYIDHRSPELLQLTKKIQDDRKNRIYKIIDKLKEAGINVDVQQVLKNAGKGSAGRPHIAKVLIDSGVAKNTSEAFQKYLGFGCPGYIPHFKISPIQVIELIQRVGGVAVFAHPAVSKCDEIIEELVSAGLKGIEVYYGKHRDHDIKKYLNIAKKHGLLATGGSDFHGKGLLGNVYLGKVKLHDDEVDRLKAVAGVKV